MRNTILKWLILVALLTYTACISVWAGQEAGRHCCQGIDVVVEGKVESDSIIRKGIMEKMSRYPEKIIGRQLSQINTGDVRNYLSRLSSLENVECLLTADRRLLINVQPIVPEIRVFNGNQSQYVNKDGKSISTDAQFYADVPVVSGNFNRNFSPVQVLPLTRFIQKDPEMKRLVSMVVAKDKNNLLIVPRIQGHIINFGDTTRLDEKKKALFAFYKKVLPHKGWNQYDTISVKYRNQIVATRRDKTLRQHTLPGEEETDLEEATLPDLETVENTETV